VFKRDDFIVEQTLAKDVFLRLMARTTKRALPRATVTAAARRTLTQRWDTRAPAFLKSFRLTAASFAPRQREQQDLRALARAGMQEASETLQVISVSLWGPR
jgi:hypothetical protein